MRPPTIWSIYRNGRNYDQLFDYSQATDITFWMSQAGRYGSPVLELACGTGRVSLPLAQAGLHVTGVDISEPMLREARLKAAEAGVSVDWVQGDMRDLHLDRVFSLIFLPANALCHLLDLADLEACLASVKEHLAPQGRFIIDVFVPKMELLTNQPGVRFPFAEYDDPDSGRHIVVTHSYVYEPDTQIKRITTYHAISGQDAEIEGRLDMRMYYPQELDALIKYNGLILESKYGDYDNSAFGPRSEHQLLVCRLPEPSVM